MVSENNRRKLQIVQESLGSIKDIIISNNQSRFSDDFKNYDRETRKNIALSNFLSLFPRVTIESLALLALVSFSVIFLLNSSNNNDLIIIIGSLAIAAQRLLPLSQQIYTGFAGINNNSSSLEKIISSLEKNKLVNKFNIALEEFSKHYNFKVIDVYSHTNEKKFSNNLFHSDDFHLNNKIFGIVSDQLKKFINKN